MTTKTTIETLLNYNDKLLLSDNAGYYPNEYAKGLVKMILYVTGNYNFVKDSIYLYVLDKHVRKEHILELQQLGTKKPLAKKLNVLLKIFDKYCKIKPHYEDVGYHKAEYVKTKFYDVYGSIPEVIGEYISNSLSKYKEEDKQIYTDMEIKIRNEIEMQNPTTKQLFEELVK